MSNRDHAEARPFDGVTMTDDPPAHGAAAAEPLLAALRDLSVVRGFRLSDWNSLVRQGRSAGLLARLALRIDDSEPGSVPPAALVHLDGERVLAAKQERDVRSEVRYLQRALAEIGVPIILLKGAAYRMAGLPPARGRLFTDIDILVPEAELAAVETALQRHGWTSADASAYDNRFYREWMHEIPPMSHRERQTTVDVHHTIVPKTTGIKLEAAKLFANARAFDATGTVKVLAPEDMTLHSATHLLNEGEFARGLRDLDDINLLLRHFGAEPAFWPRLVARAAELDLSRPLFYALRYSHRLLGTPVPAELLVPRRPAAPNPALRRLMDGLFTRVFGETAESERGPRTMLALWLLYLRSHYLRLPLVLLVPHLARKAYIHLTAKKED